MTDHKDKEVLIDKRLDELNGLIDEFKSRTSDPLRKSLSTGEMRLVYLSFFLCVVMIVFDLSSSGQLQILEYALYAVGTVFFGRSGVKVSQIIVRNRKVD